MTFKDTVKSALIILGGLGLCGVLLHQAIKITENATPAVAKVDTGMVRIPHWGYVSKVCEHGRAIYLSSTGMWGVDNAPECQRK